MRKRLGALVAAVLSGAAIGASAEEATGMVEGIDLQSRMILLDDGTVFTVDRSVVLEALRWGAEVTVSYEEKDGQKLISKLMVERE